jgi:hypothetical protein
MSSDRITNEDLDNMLSHYVNACIDLGMLPDGYRVVLSHGGSGRAFRIHLTGYPAKVDGVWTYPNGSGESAPPTGDDYLGMNKKAAYHTLNQITRTLWSVQRHLEKAGN